MYKISKPNNDDLSAYCSNKAALLRAVIESFINGETFQLQVRNRRTVQIGVGARTMTRKFLTSLLQVNKLESYLAMSYVKQKTLIEKLRQNTYSDEKIFKPLGAGIFDRHFDGTPEPYDDFNEICYEIFVNRGYETIDKSGFIREKQLRICPYCGMEVVRESDRSKRQIDHFLPKRKYPFLALSYFNLIPACDLCNEVPNKGATDPLVQRDSMKVIMHPYGFNDDIVRFHLDIADTNVYEPENFSVVVGFKHKAYLDGYDSFFDISDRYASSNQEASEDYTKLMEFKARHYYDEMNVNNDWLNKAYRAVTGYTVESDKPHLKARHRMRRDIFIQLNNLRQPDTYYIKGSGNNTVQLT